MRILGFSKKWDKLYKKEDELFTTFRYPRRDKDWELEEVVQVVYKPRSKERESLGMARIIHIQKKDLRKKYWDYPSVAEVRADPEVIIPPEAYDDGFIDPSGKFAVEKMVNYIRQIERLPIVNKLTLYWIERFNGKA